MPDEKPSLAAFADRFLREQRYVAKQAAKIEAERARREKGQMLRVAGVDVRDTFNSAKAQRDRGRARANAAKSPWTKERVLEALRAHYRQYDEWPTGYAWERGAPGRPTSARVRQLFGKWAQAIEEARQ